MIIAYRIDGDSAVEVSGREMAPRGRISAGAVIGNAEAELSRGDYTVRQIQDYAARKTGLYLTQWPETPTGKIAAHTVHVSSTPTADPNYINNRVWFESVFTDRPAPQSLAATATAAVTAMQAAESARLAAIGSQRQGIILNAFVEQVVSSDSGMTAEGVTNFISSNPDNAIVIAVKAALQDMLDSGWGQ